MNSKLKKITKKAITKKEEARLIKEKKDKRAVSDKKRKYIASEVERYLTDLDENCTENANRGVYVYPILYDLDSPGGGSGDYWSPSHKRKVEYKDEIIKKLQKALVDSDYILEEKTWYVYDIYSDAHDRYDGLCVCWGTEKQVMNNLEKRWNDV